MAGWPGNYQTYNQPQNYQGHCPPNMVHQVTQSLGMASLSHPSDPLEYAAQGHGMLTYPVRGPELDGEDFRQFWNAAHKNKNCTGMRLPPGEYHIKPPDNCEYHHLHMACKEDGDDRTSPFVMDLSNTFLWLTARNHGGIQIDKGENVTLQGPFALCHTKEAWPFGQATLVSHSDDKLEWIVHGHDGYPNDRVFLRDNCSLNATVFDPYTRLMKGPDKHDLRTTKLEKTGDNQYKLTLPDPQDNEMNPGDYFTARSGDGSSTLSLGDCIRCSVIGATIHTSSCFGYFDGSGTANEYRDCFIMPYPRPIGNDGQLPLWSTNADGMHATDNAQGPRMLNCYFGGLGDDCIAVTGHFAPVLAACAEEKYVIVVFVRRYLKADSGDPVQGYKPDGTDIGAGTIDRVEECDNPLTEDTPLPTFGCDNAKKEYCSKVFLQEWPEGWGDIALGCTTTFPTWSGAGFQVVGCNAYNTRGRGVLAKGSHGLIVDSHFKHLKGAAIQLTPEFECCEAGFMTDIVVRNNTIESLGQGIWVGGCTSAEYGQLPCPFQNNKNILIEGNTISYCQTTPLMITSSSDVMVRGNTFRNCLPVRPEQPEKDTRVHCWEVDRKLMLFCHVHNLTLAKNRFIKDAPQEFKGDYENPAEFCECENVVNEPDTCGEQPHLSYQPTGPTYSTYPTSTS